MVIEKRATQKYTDFTSDDIKKYLENLRKAIIGGKYTISINNNRKENIDFIEDYKIDTKKEKYPIRIKRGIINRSLPNLRAPI